MKRLALIAVGLIAVALIVVDYVNRPVTPAPGIEGAESSDSCISCHTNKDILIELAVAPEKIKSEQTSGEG